MEPSSKMHILSFNLNKSYLCYRIQGPESLNSEKWLKSFTLLHIAVLESYRRPTRFLQRNLILLYWFSQQRFKVNKHVNAIHLCMMVREMGICSVQTDRSEIYTHQPKKNHGLYEINMIMSDSNPLLRRYGFFSLK